MAFRCGLAALAFPRVGLAGSARDYLNAPIDTWLTFYNLGYSTLVTPEEGMDVTSSVTFERPFAVDCRYADDGLSGVARRNLGDLSLSATKREFGRLCHLESRNFGYRFPSAGEHIRWAGADEEQFGSFVPQTYSSFHLLVATPLGKYEPENPLNPSANRWTFFPTVNYSYTPDEGWTWLETSLSTKVFTTNPDYRVAGASTLTQKPLFLVEGHASRNFLPALWVSADTYYSVGGETSIDGVSQNNAANTLRLGAGMGLSVWSGGDVILNYERVVAKPAGQPDAQTIRMTIRQLW